MHLCWMFTLTGLGLNLLYALAEIIFNAHCRSILCSLWCCHVVLHASSTTLWKRPCHNLYKSLWVMHITQPLSCRTLLRCISTFFVWVAKGIDILRILCTYRESMYSVSVIFDSTDFYFHTDWTSMKHISKYLLLSSAKATWVWNNRSE